jgi:hypothetical protein
MRGNSIFLRRGNYITRKRRLLREYLYVVMVLMKRNCCLAFHITVELVNKGKRYSTKDYATLSTRKEKIRFIPFVGVYQQLFLLRIGHG